MTQAIGKAAESALKISFPNPAERLNSSHALLLTLEHDKFVDPGLAFKLISIRAIPFEEAVEVMLNSGEREPGARTEVFRRQMDECMNAPRRHQAITIFRYTDLTTKLTSTFLRAENVAPIAPFLTVAPDWEEVAKHYPSDCFTTEYDWNATPKPPCRRKPSLRNFIDTHFEALRKGRILALSIYSPDPKLS